MKFRLFGAFLLAGTSIAGQGLAQETIRVDATPAQFSEMFEELVSAFETANPSIKVELDTSQPDQPAALQRTLRNGLVGDLPDVSFQGLNYLKTIANAGYVQPLNALVEADATWSEDYSPSVAAAGTIDGTIYGLGAATAYPIIFYNADLVAEVQDGNRDLPEDWDGILAVAAKIAAAHPDVLGAYTLYNSAMVQGYLMSSGGALGNDAGTEIAFNDDKGMAVLELFKTFGELGQGAQDMTIPQARQAFASGQIGIMADSSSTLASYAEQADGNFEIGTAHFPFSAENARLPTLGIGMVLHATEADRQQASWTFMRFIAGPEGQNIIGRATGYVPANQVAVERADLLGDYYKANPAIQAALDSIPHAASWYAFNGPNAAQIDTVLGDYMQQLVTQQATPEQTMDALVEEIPGLIQ